MITRALGALSLLLAIVSPAFAQSDARKLAIFYFQGDEANIFYRSTGNDPAASPGPYSETMQNALVQLDQMGVPYDIYELADTTNWWKKLGELGPLASNNPGVADSIRFRRAGYLGAFCVTPSTFSAEPYFKRFQDGRVRGSQMASPLGGRWGIPCLVLSDGLENQVAYPFWNGAAYISIGVTSPTGESYIRKGFKKTATDFSDTLDVGRASNWQVQTGQIDSIDVLIRADSLGLTGSQGGRMVAWKWKSSAYYYPTGDAGTSIWSLLGLNTIFEAAGYTPRRKLNLHLTLDHPIPETITDTAPSESVWTYIDYNKWRFSAAMKAHTLERVNQTAAMTAYWVGKMRAASIGGYPHSHVRGIGNYYDTGWNHVTFADTALKRQRWNLMEKAITDTLKLTAAAGYERTIGFPGDGVYYPDLYIFAQNRYTDIRSFASDSLGSQTGAAYQRIYSGPATTYGARAFARLPYPYIEATTGRTVWVHDLYTSPGDSVTVWSSFGSTFSNDIDGKAHTFLREMCKSVTYDADFYWHPNYNLQNSGSERPMQIMMRRMAYLMGRLRRVCTVEPHYLDKTPRRTSIPRG